MLLNADGAFEILFSIGFEESEDALILPLSCPLGILRAYHKAIEETIPLQKSVEFKQPPEVTKPERDIICNGDVCIDLGKERPLMDFSKHTFMTEIKNLAEIDFQSKASKILKT